MFNNKFRMLRGRGLGFGGGGGNGRGLGFGPGGGRARNSGGGCGIGGTCVCTKCGERIPHQRGEVCTTLKCPKCGSTMVREELLNRRTANV